MQKEKEQEASNKNFGTTSGAEISFKKFPNNFTGHVYGAQFFFAQQQIILERLVRYISEAEKT